MTMIGTLRSPDRPQRIQRCRLDTPEGAAGIDSVSCLVEFEVALSRRSDGRGTGRQTDVVEVLAGRLQGRECGDDLHLVAAGCSHRGPGHRSFFFCRLARPQRRRSQSGPKGPSRLISKRLNHGQCVPTSITMRAQPMTSRRWPIAAGVVGRRAFSSNHVVLSALPHGEADRLPAG